jgi:alpha-mannosidase
MRTVILCILHTFLSVVIMAQPKFADNTIILGGYARKISGTDFNYHSSIPFVKESMLLRATDGNWSMEWETEPVPAELNADSVTFVWLAGLGSSPGIASFDLFVNDDHKFTFWADGSDGWTLTAEDGSSLSFHKDLVDEHGDRFGFIFLKMPASNLTPGESLRLKIVGGKFGITAWYMTFKFPLTSGVVFKGLPAIFEDIGRKYQLGIAGILHFGQPSHAIIFIDNNLVNETDLEFGYNYVRVNLPLASDRRTVDYRLDVEGKIWEGELTLDPVRKWRVNFVQHTHTDIGYTRSQTEILGEHLRFIDYALDYCDITDDYPDEAKFRWTCEASWAVDEYLRSRPARQIERLLRRIREGRIEITGMYLNFDELPDEQTLAATLRPLKRFREMGIEVTAAMQNDVNGIGWCLNEFYSDMGIKYLTMGTHGHRALISFDKPTVFWWESPSGKRMLAYRGEHYMTGNTVFKIHAGDFNRFEEELLNYLVELESKGYNHDLISIQHSGYLTDNSPPSTLASNMILQWNEKYIWPKLRTATTLEFFTDIQAEYGDDFPVIRGAWPDWWTDGFGASAREVAALREAQKDLLANTAGLTMALLRGEDLPGKISDRIEAANTAMIFYVEHTVGYHNSVREPFSKNTKEQRAIKESFAWEAVRRTKMLGEETMGLLQNSITREPDPSLVVYNTLNWNRSGLFTIYIDHQIIPRYSTFSILDQNGNRLKVQPVEHHPDGTYWAIWVDDIPAFGHRKFIIQVDHSDSIQSPAQENSQIYELENKWYKIIIDAGRGAITSIFDKELNVELVDQDAEWKFGEFIYELLDNRSQMESFRLDNYHREPLEKVWFDRTIEGEIWNAIRFKGNTPAAIRDGGYEFEVRLFNTAKRIDLVYAIEKKMVTDPEGIYIALPFTLNEGQLSFEVQGGEIRAGIDQIPGSANDWNTVQNYARLYNSDAQIILVSQEIPLMQFGGINTGRYEAGALPESNHIYAWPMNNYWVTNFNAEQHGGHAWAFSISSRLDTSMENAVQFGWGNRTPFLTRTFPGGGSGDEVWEGSYITGWPANIILISAIPAEDGLSAIFHVRETGGKSTELVLRNGITGKVLELIPVDVTGHPLEETGNGLIPFETKFFRANL